MMGSREVVDNLWREGINFFFPPRCPGCGKKGTWFCEDCLSHLTYTKNQICLVCGEPAISGFTHPGCETRYTPDRFLTPFIFRGPLRRALYGFKYRGRFALSKILGELVGEWLEYREVSFLPGAALVPIPLHWFKRLRRGFNQAELLAQVLERELNLPLDPSLLKRTRYTVSQTRLSEKERRKNIKGAFICPHPEKVKGKNLVLVDDVCTTGATLREAARTLKHAGARTVWVITLARGGNF